MRFISTKVHGMLDYLMGLILFVSPWLFGFATGGAAQYVPMIVGVAVIAYSLVTRYEWGVTGLISMQTHLWLDVAGGALLALSPWLFGFAEIVRVPHLLFGLLEVAAGLMTQTRPSAAPREART
jgi:hypothetical protein